MNYTGKVTRSVSISSMPLVTVIEKSLFLTKLIKKRHNTHVNQVSYQFVKNYIFKIHLNEKITKSKHFFFIKVVINQKKIIPNNID